MGEKSNINNLSFCFQEFEKEKQIKPKVRRREGIIKIKAESYEIGKKKKERKT